jgi:diguanylate cyclase (GGDEF)-like protein
VVTLLQRLHLSTWKKHEDGRLWMGIYIVRTIMLFVMSIAAAIADAPRISAFVMLVVVPYNLIMMSFHRRHGRAHNLLPLDQVLAAISTLIAVQAAYGTVISSLVGAVSATMSLPPRRVQTFVCAGSAVLFAAAIVHHDQTLLAFVPVQLGSAFALANTVSYLKNKRSAASDRFESLLDGLHAYVHEADLRTGEILYSNNQITESIGRITQLQDLAQHVHPDDLPTVLRALEKGAANLAPASFDIRIMVGDTTMYMEQRMTFAKVRGRTRVRSVLFDVSARKHIELEMAHRAFHDPLTELPNRALFLDRLDHALSRAEKTNTEHAVLLLDLDNFKDVNDGMGHHVGDDLLIEVGRRLNRKTSRTDTLARLGGDEFAILLEDTNSEEAILIGRELIHIVGGAYLNGEITLFPRISIGISNYPKNGTTGSELLRQADVAMYYAKRHRLGVAGFDDEMNPDSAQKLSVLADFRDALMNNELEAFFQPVVDAGTGAIASCEALVRWNHPKLGLLSPASFVPVVCAGGLSSELARWMLTEVVTQIESWTRQGVEIPVSVNMSAVDIADDSLVDWLLAEIALREISPKLLTIELTEAELLDQSDRTILTLKRLRDAGVATAVDDFGTGYSSLVWLRDLPIGALKIDRSFIDSMFTDERSETIIRSTIQMAKALHLNIIGEGVETSEAAAALRNLGCHNLQGYLFSRPVSAQKMTAILTSGVNPKEVDVAPSVV